MSLTVSDNGVGADIGEDYIPKSLRRRAKLLKADLRVEYPPAGGTSVTLDLKLKPWKLFRSNNLKK